MNINIGAGKWRHPDFKNVDMTHPKYPLNKVDFEYQLRDKIPLPIASNSCNVVYCSHVLEHIEDIYAENLLKEIARVLIPGGICRIVSPDFALAYAAYKAGNNDFFIKWSESLKDYSVPQNFMRFFLSPLCTSAIHHRRDLILTDEEIDAAFKTSFDEITYKRLLNTISKTIIKKYPNWHINWWTQNKLETITSAMKLPLKLYPNCRGQSIAPILRDMKYFDRISWDPISFYIDLKKAK